MEKPSSFDKEMFERWKKENPDETLPELEREKLRQEINEEFGSWKEPPESPRQDRVYNHPVPKVEKHELDEEEEPEESGSSQESAED